MKKLLILVALLFSSPVFAEEKHNSRPFRYETECGIESKGEFLTDTCVVIETRVKGGALRSRNIFSNKFALTIKSKYTDENGLMTWDSHNKFEYKWEYKVGGSQELGAWTYVMPGFLVQNISWD